MHYKNRDQLRLIQLTLILFAAQVVVCTSEFLPVTKSPNILSQFFVVFLFSTLLFGIAISLVYVAYCTWNFFTLDEETREEIRPLLDKQSSPPFSAPVFGEKGWFWMAGLAALFLISRCGWQNASKVIMQFHWTDESSDYETFRKPLFIAFMPMVAIAIYFPFCGLDIRLIRGNLYKTLVCLALFQAGASLIFVGIFSYFYNQMNVWVGLSIAVILVGTVVGCLTPALISGETRQEENWTFVLGVGSLLASAFCQAGRLVVQELTYSGDSKITAVQLSSSYSLFSCVFFLTVSLLAQFVPGPDNGVQEDMVDSIIKVANSSVNQPYLAFVLVLLLVLCSSNIILLATLVKEYGATTARILMSFEIFATWLFAVLIFYIFEFSSVEAFQGTGEPFDLSQSYFKIIGAVLIMGGTEFYLRAKREMRSP